MKYIVTIELPSFATVVVEAKDELEAERLAEGEMYDVPIEEFHPNDNDNDNGEAVVFDGSAVAMEE